MKLAPKRTLDGTQLYSVRHTTVITVSLRRKRIFVLNKMNLILTLTSPKNINYEENIAYERLIRHRQTKIVYQDNLKLINLFLVSSFSWIKAKNKVIRLKEDNPSSFSPSKYEKAKRPNFRKSRPLLKKALQFSTR